LNISCYFCIVTGWQD